ncbi:tyrosine-type recombinase/integrase [Mycoplana dimorpha]|uniref:Integrase n=1 Tax=Mycoplana dimorpha TaxID=28320 RepID=A0A2T5BEB8_MYCDI|nr:site-specific integrase [Mycoplana dimorpha]PTM97310.1 integrase [Mycoplana dimorpha]
MSKSLHRLTVKQIEATTPGSALADGGGLLYRSTARGAGKWSFKFVSPDLDYRAEQAAKGSNSFQRAMGLGAFPSITLAAARDKAAAARGLLAKGVDPIEADRRAQASARQRGAELARAASDQAMTFGRYADEHFLPYALTGFSNAAHIQQWQATFATHAATLREKPLAEITREDILAVLHPIWTTKGVTASRSRQRIERLFAHAIQNGRYRGDNPASWRQFDATLPSPKTLVRHHPAVPHDKLADFVAAVRAKQADSMAALMLEWITLAACRTGEARFATWDEIDLERRVWAVPAGRMKMRRDHVVPITARMAEILAEAKIRRHDVKPTDYVFSSPKGKPLTEMAALMLMRRMEPYKDYTAHGLRATFKGWAATATDFPRELIEEQLAHQLGAVERAYMRQSAYERRRPMMEAWAALCAGATRAGDMGDDLVTDGDEGTA